MHISETANAIYFTLGKRTGGDPRESRVKFGASRTDDALNIKQKVVGVM